MKKTAQINIVLISCFILTACFTTIPKHTTKTTRTILIDHSLITNLYVQVTNTSGGGGEKMDLAQSIRNKLIAKGYNLVASSKNADVGLYVNVLFANNLREANAIRAGVSTGTATVAGTDNLYVIAGAVLVGAVIGKFSEDETFRGLIDVKVRNYHDSNVRVNKVTTIGDAKFKNIKRSGALNTFSGEMRSSDATSVLQANIRTATNEESYKSYSEQASRIMTEAVQMNLDLTKAIPILQEQVANQIANIF